MCFVNLLKVHSSCCEGFPMIHQEITHLLFKNLQKFLFLVCSYYSGKSKMVVLGIKSDLASF